MNIKKFLIFGLLVIIGLFMVACGETDSGEDGKKDDDIEQKDDDKKDDEEKKEDTQQSEINFAANEQDLEVIKSTAKTEYDKVFEEATKNFTDEQKAVLKVKYDQIITKVEAAKGTAEAVKQELNTYYKQLKETVALLKQTVDTFEKQKEQALAELKVIYDSIAAVANPTTLEYVKSLYDQAVAQVNALEETSKAQLKEITKAFAEAGKEYVKIIATEALAIAIEYARQELKKLADAAIAKIEKQSLKDKVTELYNTVDLKIAGIVESDKVDELVEKYVEEFSVKLVELFKEEACLTVEQYKALAIDRLDRIYNQYKEKMPDDTTKQVLKDFYDATVANINACTTMDEVKAIYDNIEKTVKEYVSKDLIATLVTGYKGKLQEVVTGIVDKIPYNEVKATINQLVATELAKLDGIKDIDELKAKFEEIKEQLPKDIEAIVKEHVEGLIADAKTAAKTYINTALDAAIAKIDDATVKAQLTAAKNTALAELANVKDEATFETAIENIKTKFAGEVAKALSTLVKKYTDLAKAEADKVVALVNAKLSTASQTAYKAIYDNYVKALEAITNVETAAKDAEDATKQFMTDSQIYITEALNSLKQEALNTLKTKYDEAVADVDIQTYKDAFDTLYTTAQTAVNALVDIATFATESAKVLTTFVTESAKQTAAYLTAKAEVLKTEALANGKTFYDGVYLKEEYTSMGIVNKGIAKAKIEAAYIAFKTTIESLTPAVGAKTVCDEAYNLLVSTCNKALGITTE